MEAWGVSPHGHRGLKAGDKEQGELCLFSMLGAGSISQEEGCCKGCLIAPNCNYGQALKHQFSDGHTGTSQMLGLQIFIPR